MPTLDERVGDSNPSVDYAVRRSSAFVGIRALWHDEKVNGKGPETLTLAELRQHARHVVRLADFARELHWRVQLDVELKTPGIEAQVIDVRRDEAAQ